MPVDIIVGQMECMGPGDVWRWEDRRRWNMAEERDAREWVKRTRKAYNLPTQFCRAARLVQRRTIDTVIKE